MTATTATARANKYGAKSACCGTWIEPLEGALTNEAGRWTTRHIGPCPVAAAPAAPAHAEPGYYVQGTDLVCVVLNREQTRTYAKRLVVGTRDGRKHVSWEYAPGVGATLAGMRPMTVEDAAAFGHLHGFCFRCCKPLTDPTSVRQGYGPVCIKKIGR